MQRGFAGLLISMALWAAAPGPAWAAHAPFCQAFGASSSDADAAADAAVELFQERELASFLARVQSARTLKLEPRMKVLFVHLDGRPAFVLRLQMGARRQSIFRQSAFFEAFVSAGSRFIAPGRNALVRRLRADEVDAFRSAFALRSQNKASDRDRLLGELASASAISLASYLTPDEPTEEDRDIPAIAMGHFELIARRAPALFRRATLDAFGVSFTGEEAQSLFERRYPLQLSLSRILLSADARRRLADAWIPRVILGDSDFNSTNVIRFRGRIMGIDMASDSGVTEDTHVFHNPLALGDDDAAAFYAAYASPSVWEALARLDEAALRSWASQAGFRLSAEHASAIFARRDALVRLRGAGG